MGRKELWERGRMEGQITGRKRTLTKERRMVVLEEGGKEGDDKRG